MKILECLLKRKKQIIKAIKRRLKRNKSFKHTSKHAGKGIKGRLKRLHVLNEKGDVIETLENKESIEDEIRKT